MRFEIKKLFSDVAAKHLLRAGGAAGSTSSSNPGTLKGSFARGVALLMLSIPAIAFAPWQGGESDTSAAGQAEASHDVDLGNPASAVAPPAVGQGVISSLVNSAEATIDLAGSLAYSSFPWNNRGGIRLSDDENGLGHSGGIGNARFGTSGSGGGSSFGGAGGGLPETWAGFPSAWHPAGDLGLGGSRVGPSTGNGAPPSASAAPAGTNSPAVPDSLPATNSSDPAAPRIVAERSPGDTSEPGEHPGPTGPGTPPIVDDKAPTLPDDPVLQALLPPPDPFPGDPAAGGPSFLKPLESAAAEPVVGAAAVPAPGTALLMLLAFPLLLFVKRRVAR